MATVHIDPALHARIEEEIRGSEFRTVDEYVDFVLREMLGASNGVVADEAAGEEAVAETLQKLGYM